MLLAWALGLLLCALTIAIHYEAMHWLALNVRRLSQHRRRRMLLAVLILFAAHVAEVYLFAAGYYAGAEWLGMGALEGVIDGGFDDFIYFSAASYTSVGYGDVFATGGLRIIGGLEALVGLLMIAWSGAFTVYFLERRWSQEGREREG